MIVKFLLGLWIGWNAYQRYQGATLMLECARDPDANRDSDDAWEEKVETIRRSLKTHPRTTVVTAHAMWLVLFVAFPLIVLGMAGFFR